MNTEKITLHEAMEIVLSECPNKTATFEHVSSEIASRKLYYRRDGDFPPPYQIGMRVRKYPHLFDIIPPDKVRLK